MSKKEKNDILAVCESLGIELWGHVEEENE